MSTQDLAGIDFGLFNDQERSTINIDFSTYAIGIVNWAASTAEKLTILDVYVGMAEMAKDLPSATKLLWDREVCYEPLNHSFFCNLS